MRVLEEELGSNPSPGKASHTRAGVSALQTLVLAQPRDLLIHAWRHGYGAAWIFCRVIDELPPDRKNQGDEIGWTHGVSYHRGETKGRLQIVESLRSGLWIL